MRSQEEFNAEVFRRGAQRKDRRRKARRLALLAAPLVAGGLLWAAFSGSAEKRENNYQEAAPLSLEVGRESALSTAASPTQKTVDALSRLEMPAGVYIDIKMKVKK